MLQNTVTAHVLSGLGAGVAAPVARHETDAESVTRASSERSAELSLEDRRRAALERAASTKRRILQVRADRLAATVEFAHLYPALDAASAGAKARHAHGEAAVMDEGDGCPLVAEFAPMEYAARMGMRPETAAAEITTALKLRHRLPSVWDAVMDLVVPVHVGEELAWVTSDLPAELCVDLGRELAGVAAGLSHKRLVEHAKARVLQLQHQPEHDRRTKALRNRDVTVSRGDHTSFIAASLSHQDGIWLDARVSQLATILGRAGDGSSLQVRRSKALGLLASPARALQLLQADAECRAATGPAAAYATLFDDLDMDPACPAHGQRGHLCGQVTVDPNKLLPTTNVVVHLTDTTLRDALSDPPSRDIAASPDPSDATTDTTERGGLADVTAGNPVSDELCGGGEGSSANDSGSSPPPEGGGIACQSGGTQVRRSRISETSGVARLEGVGPVLAVWLRELLADSQVRVRPVLDLHALHPVDAYQVPPLMREAVLLRHPTSVWPYSTRSSSGLDLDHSQSHAVPGPPGQTRIGNLGPLTRREHRAKTHGDWKLEQPTAGVFDWMSGLGYHYRVTPTGTSTTGLRPPPTSIVGWRVDAAGATAAAFAAGGVRDVTRRHVPMVAVSQSTFDYRDWQAERHFDAIEAEWDRQEAMARAQRSGAATRSCAGGRRFTQGSQFAQVS